MFSKTLRTGSVSSAKQYDCLLYEPLRNGHEHLRFKQYLRHRDDVRRAASPVGICASSTDTTAPLRPWVFATFRSTASTGSQLSKLKQSSRSYSFSLLRTANVPLCNANLPACARATPHSAASAVSRDNLLDIRWFEATRR